jgi:uncharacterized protein (TIGR00369 family)
LKLADDGYCFVCGPRNPVGLKLEFRFNGKTITTEFIPKKEHQGYLDIVHGGIISTLLDEAMVKLAIAMDMPAVTARMDVRLKKALAIGEKVNIESGVIKETRKTIDAYARAVNGDNVVIADAKGTLVKVKAKVEVET